MLTELTFSNILTGLAGITSDANSLVNFARNSAQRHLFTYDEDIPVEMLVQRLCDMKQGYTQYGGMSDCASADILCLRADLKVFVHLASRSSTSAGIRCTDFSCTSRTLPATTLAGRLRALARTTHPRPLSSSRTTRMTLRSRRPRPCVSRPWPRLWTLPSSAARSVSS